MAVQYAILGSRHARIAQGSPTGGTPCPPFQGLEYHALLWHASCISSTVKPLSPESRRQQQASSWAWLPRETAEALVLKVVALTVLLRAFFYSSSQDRPPQVDRSHMFLERQLVSPLSPTLSTE
jgi:hypothetical protein